MTIHREGYRTILIVGGLLALINVVAFKFLCAEYCWISMSVLAISLIFWLFIVSFFRIPNRKLTIDENAVVSPCDGKVVVMEEVFDEEYNSSQDDLASVPGDEAELPLSANDSVDRRYHLFRFLQISRALVLTELNC
jgi:phosphatidylserine decarboxylase